MSAGAPAYRVAKRALDLALTEDALAEKRAILHRRLTDIYKRGPLFATEALLAAKSFGELVARYKYLHELATYDRAVVRRVEDLHKQIGSQRQLLVRLQDEAFEKPGHVGQVPLGRAGVRHALDGHVLR